jgi:hypothetical protein
MAALALAGAITAAGTPAQAVTAPPVLVATGTTATVAVAPGAPGGQPGAERAMSGATAGGAAASDCTPGLNIYNRTELCFRTAVTVRVVRKNVQIGTITFDLTHAVTLDAGGRTFTDRIVLSDLSESGQYSGVRLGLVASCGTHCTADDQFPQGKAITEGSTGTISYDSSVGSGQSTSTRTTYRLTFSKPGDESGSFSYQTPIAYRCDDALPGVAAGCVFPEYAPYLKILDSLDAVAYNIATAQEDPAHYGRPGHYPLIRASLSAQQAASYYSAVCGSQVAPGPGLACDEYPFRTTDEGGTRVGVRNRRTAWVPAAQEAAKNKDIAAFYAAGRVLPCDEFWVVT